MEAAERPYTPKSIVVDIVNLMNLRTRVTSWEDDEEIHVDVWGDNLGILIGRGGATLQALQDIVTTIIRRNGRETRRIIIDVERYRERRRQKLREYAQKMAEKALTTRKPVRLEPMPPRERKIVHDALKDVGGVESKSEGEEPERRIVITPA
ncbi:MAG: KH domain-containing protein [Actinobacteria bacterium]|nr:KH domain-containing protein [Actinomycetota bacterium]MDI6830759.1 RNA-binding cell elongation regulator Jag/EloR [Actinomycetota bacterium]